MLQSFSNTFINTAKILEVPIVARTLHERSKCCFPCYGNSACLQSCDFYIPAPSVCFSTSQPTYCPRHNCMLLGFAFTFKPGTLLPFTEKSLPGTSTSINFHPCDGIKRGNFDRPCLRKLDSIALRQQHHSSNTKNSPVGESDV